MSNNVGKPWEFPHRKILQKKNPGLMSINGLLAVNFSEYILCNKFEIKSFGDKKSILI